VSSKTVLIVEDNDIEREGLAAVVQDQGYQVQLAANGTEALSYLQKTPTPDVVLLDMMMAPEDGWQVLRKVQRSRTQPPVPIIIVTGLDIASPEWATSLGASGLIHKPIDKEELLGELSRFN